MEKGCPRESACALSTMSKWPSCRSSHTVSISRRARPTANPGPTSAGQPPPQPRDEDVDDDDFEEEEQEGESFSINRSQEAHPIRCRVVSMHTTCRRLPARRCGANWGSPPRRTLPHRDCVVAARPSIPKMPTPQENGGEEGGGGGRRKCSLITSNF